MQTTWNMQSRPKVEQKIECSTITAEPQPVEKKVRLNPARAHEDYWRKRLKQRTNKNYQVRIQVNGVQTWFNLHTANKDAAAAMARDVYVHLNLHGAESCLKKYKEQNKAGAKVTVATIGEFLDDVRANSDLKAGTFEIYARKFRSMVSGVCEIDDSDRKFDYAKGGNKEWLHRVHAVALDALTPEAVNKWKREKINAAGDPVKQRRANITLRSLMLSSKSLFTPAIREKLSVRLPSPLWFEGVKLPKRERSRYRSEINPATLMLCAKKELAEGENMAQATLTKRKNSAHWWITDKMGVPRSTRLRWSDAKETAQAQKILAEENAKPAPINKRPELYKMFLLAFGCGLRRGEIDVLTWSRMIWHENKIRVEVTEHGTTKTEESEGDVSVDPATMAELKRYMPPPGKGGQFVIESGNAARPGSVRSKHYRCDGLFTKLIRWLASKGVTARNAVHTLRKECGSQVYAAHGIVEAQKIMRHADLSITREHYVSGNAKTATFNPLALIAQTEIKAAK
jgi:integrase